METFVEAPALFSSLISPRRICSSSSNSSSALLQPVKKKYTKKKSTRRRRSARGKYTLSGSVSTCKPESRENTYTRVSRVRLCFRERALLTSKLSTNKFRANQHAFRPKERRPFVTRPRNPASVGSISVLCSSNWRAQAAIDASSERLVERVEFTRLTRAVRIWNAMVQARRRRRTRRLRSPWSNVKKKPLLLIKQI